MVIPVIFMLYLMAISLIGIFIVGFSSRHVTVILLAAVVILLIHPHSSCWDIAVAAVLESTTSTIGVSDAVIPEKVIICVCWNRNTTKITDTTGANPVHLRCKRTAQDGPGEQAYRRRDSVIQLRRNVKQDIRDLAEQPEPDTEPVHLHISARRLSGVQNRSVKRGKLHLGHIWTAIIKEQWRELHIHGKEKPKHSNRV